MADFDVSVVELTTPAATAPLAQTRPVVSVRNNGLHDAVASGYVRIYSAGLLIYESEVYSDTIGPGETRPASAVDLWTPPAEGIYMVQGYVSTPLDQVEPNNNLWPTAVTISGIEPPPPTPVPLHASQHEEGGGDEMSLEDLPGRAADRQRPTTHASDHELSGVDPVNVNGMPGVLGEAQTPKAHATSHKTGGGDALSVLTLPDVTDLELLAHKEMVNGYAGLDANGQVGYGRVATSPGIEGTYVPVLDWPSGERIWLDAFTPSTHAASKHNNAAPSPLAPGWENAAGEADTSVKSDHLHAIPGTITTLTAPIVITAVPKFAAAIDVNLKPIALGTQIHFMASGLLDTDTPAAPAIFKVWVGSAAFQFNVTPNPGISDVPWRIEADIVVTATGPTYIRACGHLHFCPGQTGCDYYIAAPAGPLLVTDTLWGIVGEVTAGGVNDVLTVNMNEVRISKL